MMPWPLVKLPPQFFQLMVTVFAASPTVVDIAAIPHFHTATEMSVDL